MTACILKYLVNGVPTDRESQGGLKQELADTLPNALSIVVLPVVDGFSVEIEMQDLGAFSRSSFEPYVGEHVMPDALTTQFKHTNHQVKLLKAHFS